MNQRVKSVLTIVGWILSYFVYLILGAFIYVLLEQSNDVTTKRQSRRDLLNVMAANNISTNNTAVLAIIRAAINAYEVGGIDPADLSRDTETQWVFASAVFFASTIVTTIGYGNIAPVTYGGRTFTIFYALIGIPLTGLVLAKIGVGLSNVIKQADDFIGNRIRQCFPRLSKQDNMKQHIRLVQIAFVVIFFVLFFWIVPAALMTVTDDMAMVDATYFCFISITTIGLGDIVPGVSEKGVSGQLSTEAIHAATMQGLTILYFLLGLSALTIMLSLIGSLIKTLADSTIKHGKDTIKNATMAAGAGARILEAGMGGVGRTSQRMAQNMRNSMIRRESTLKEPNLQETAAGRGMADENASVASENGDNTTKDDFHCTSHSPVNDSGFDVRLISEKRGGNNPEVVVTDSNSSQPVAHYTGHYLYRPPKLPPPVQ